MSGVEIEFSFAYGFIMASCGAGLLFGIWNWFSVMSIKTEYVKDTDSESPLISNDNNVLMNEISEKIQKVFLFFIFREQQHF